MQNLNVHLVQSPLHWEDPERNLSMFEEKLSEIDTSPDLIVLPEMFTTGFTMIPHNLAEPMEGRTMQWMQEKAQMLDCVITGSIIIRDDSKYYNRLVWMQPDGQYHCYDKKHLFTYAGENKHYSPGTGKLIVELKGWKIMPVICYDMRFPAWCRNSYDEDTGFAYDAMLNVANWPGSRSHAWRVLLMARAIENQSFVIGLNRVGEDGNNIAYSGDSAIIDPRGENLSDIMPGREASETVIMPRCQLDSFRDTFRAWVDWDAFELKSHPAPGADSQ